MPAVARSPRYTIPLLAVSWLLLCIVATIIPGLPDITELLDDDLARLSVVPLISVIVVNWNGRRYLDGCLRALLAQRYPRVEVLLVDNGSTDGSVEYVHAQFPAVRVIPSPTNLGFVGGNNLALTQAQGTLIALVNNDTVAEPGWLAALARAVTPPDVAAASGTFVALGDPERVILTLPLLTPRTAHTFRVVEAAPAQDVHYAMGAGMIVKRSVIERIGLLDPGYHSYYEETDWCARMIRAGYRVVYTPDAVIQHEEGGSTSSVTKRWYMERNRIRFALKNFDLPYLLLFVPGYLIGGARRWWHATNRQAVGTLLLRATWWNVAHLRETWQARRRDHQRLAHRRSYNRSLVRRVMRSSRPSSDPEASLHPAASR